MGGGHKVNVDSGDTWTTGDCHSEIANDGGVANPFASPGIRRCTFVGTQSSRHTGRPASKSPHLPDRTFCSASLNLVFNRFPHDRARWHLIGPDFVQSHFATGDRYIAPVAMSLKGRGRPPIISYHMSLSPSPVTQSPGLLLFATYCWPSPCRCPSIPHVPPNQQLVDRRQS